MYAIKSVFGQANLLNRLRLQIFHRRTGTMTHIHQRYIYKLQKVAAPSSVLYTHSLDGKT